MDCFSSKLSSMPLLKMFIFILTLSSVFLGALGSNATCNPDTLIGRRVTVALLGTPPFIIRNNGSTRGADIDVLDILSQKLGFDYALEYQNTFGLIEDGKWTGTIGAVSRCEAHFGLGPFMLNYHTSKVVDFGFPIYDISLKLVVPKPKKLPPFINVVKPFDWTLWAGILSLWCVLPITYYLVSRWYYDGNADILSFYLKSLGMLLTQDVLEWFRKEMPKPIMVGVLLFGTSILTMSYESNLRAYLMKEDFEAQASTPEDIMQSNTPFKLFSLVSQVTFLRDSPKLSLRKLYERSVNQGDVIKPGSSLFNLVTKVNGAAHLSQDVVFLASVDAMIKHHGYIPFDLKSEPLSLGLGSLILPKQSEYKDHVYTILLHIFEQGITTHLLDKYLSFKDIKSFMSSKEDVNEPLVFNHIVLPLLSLWFGWMISTLIFVCEARGNKIKENENKMYHSSLLCF